MPKHIHIHFAPRKRTAVATATQRFIDQAPGSVPPSDVAALVEALHMALAHREGRQHTMDAGDWDESKVKRDEGGRFSAQQHTAASEHHESEAAKHDQIYKQTGSAAAAAARNAHQEAADLHKTAAGHVTAQTGWASHNAQQAHNATAKAAKLSATGAGPASMEQLKATAANPKASLEERAAAVEQLSKMEKMANAVASSPFAAPNPAEIAMKMHASGASPEAVGAATQAAMNAQPKPGPDGKPVGLHPDLAAVTPPGAPVPGSAQSPKGEINQVTGQPMQGAKPATASGLIGLDDPSHPANTPMPSPPKPAPSQGAKPTSAKATATKAATHELLSSGHPFSIDELMQATGAKNRVTLMTALSDLKSSKYAGKLGALNIVKNKDGTYQVQKLDGSRTPTEKLPGEMNPAERTKYDMENEARYGRSPQAKADQHLDAMFKSADPGVWGSKAHIISNLKEKMGVSNAEAARLHFNWANRQNKSTVSGPSTGQRDPGEKFAGAMQAAKGAAPDPTLAKSNGDWKNDIALKQAWKQAGHDEPQANRYPTMAEYGAKGNNNPHAIPAGGTQSPAMKHHGDMEAMHRQKAAEIKAKGIGNYRDHERAAQFHANALSEAKVRATTAGRGGQGYEQAAQTANALSKNMGLDPLNQNSKPGAGKPLDKAPSAPGRVEKKNADGSTTVLENGVEHTYPPGMKPDSVVNPPSAKPHVNPLTRASTEAAAQEAVAPGSKNMVVDPISHKTSMGGFSTHQGAIVSGRPAPAPALMEALHTAAKGWSGAPIPPDKVKAAAEYMHGKAGVDILKMSEATGLSVGAAKHLNEARKAHFSSNKAIAPQTPAERAAAYLKQKHIGLIKR